MLVTWPQRDISFANNNSICRNVKNMTGKRHGRKLGPLWLPVPLLQNSQTSEVANTKFLCGRGNIHFQNMSVAAQQLIAG